MKPALSISCALVALLLGMGGAYGAEGSADCEFQLSASPFELSMEEASQICGMKGRHGKFPSAREEFKLCAFSQGDRVLTKVQASECADSILGKREKENVRLGMTHGRKLLTAESASSCAPALSAKPFCVASSL